LPTGQRGRSDDTGNRERLDGRLVTERQRVRSAGNHAEFLSAGLGHGVHNATGTQGTGMSNAQGINVPEERNTVGLPATTYNDPTGATGPPANGTALPDTTGLPYTENGVRGDYASRGIDSPVTGSPPVQRPSYYPPTATDGPGGPF
jgi:hypothetical protein